MPMPPFLARLREKIGSDLIMLPSVTGFVFDDAGRLLLARHDDVKLWAAPGGGVDPGERPEECVVRELREEIGVDIDVRGLIGVFGGPEFHTVYPNGHEVAYVIAAYGCVLAPGSGEPEPDGVEINEVHWVSEEQLPSYATTPWTPVVAPKAFAWWREHAR
ncbi:NUDIX domain-containing protein [Nonomuraea sp. NPDC050643]|uniref:NUDIX domain-containing protein n=1 Tax=Nonomuraea sp. NPDC050643 TaxID=3155660 RepID=UPI0034046FB1